MSGLTEECWGVCLVPIKLTTQKMKVIYLNANICMPFFGLVCKACTLVTQSDFMAAFFIFCFNVICN